MRLRDIFIPLPRYFAYLYKSRNFLWQIVAIAATYLFVTSGFDWWWLRFARDSELKIIMLPAAMLGALFPIVLPISFLAAGHILRNRKIFSLGGLLAQSVLLGFIFSALYKAFTGRIQPAIAGVVDISRQFNFGLLKHGIFWGWPSSHTTIAFAMAFALVCAYPKNKYVKYLAPLYALFIGIGVSFGIHWFSEFIAGAIFGTIIGVVIGKNFKFS